MPRFSLEELGDAGIGLSRGPAVSLPDLGFAAGIAKGDDYLSQLDRLAKERQSRSGPESGLSLGIVGTSAGFESLSDALLTPIERRLREARSLIEQEKFELALSEVDAILRESPSHHEGLYFKALCLLRLGRLKDALVAMRPLAKARVESQLAARVAVLLGEIRNRMVVPAMLMNLLLTRTGQTVQAVQQLRELVNDDPGCGLYHFMLAGNLMQDGQLEAADAAASLGVQQCDGDERPLLEGLKRQVVQKDLELKLVPARDHFRRGNYPRARSALQRLPARYQAQTMSRTFYAYLEELGGSFFGFVGGKAPEQIQPKGTRENVEELQFFLLDPDLSRARDLMGQGEFPMARTNLEHALHYAPHFPWANHLMAIAIYRELGQPTAGGYAPSIDYVETSLGRARHHAEIGASDPDIEGSDALIKAIDAALAFMSQVRREQKAVEADDKVIAVLLTDFKSIMTDARQGISSMAEYRKIHDRMLELKRSIDKMRPGLRTQSGRESIKQVAGVVDRNIAQLETLKRDLEESERCRPLSQQYERIMAGAKGGIGSVSQLHDIKRKLSELKRSLSDVRRSLRGKEAIEFLDSLEKGIDDNCAQLERFSEAELTEAQTVKAAMDEFGQLMEKAKQGFAGRHEANEFVDGMRRLQQRVADLRRHATGQAAKQMLANLERAVDQVFKQIGAR